MFTPKKIDRVYTKPLWKMRKDGSKGKLICHSCYKCGKQVDGESSAHGAWFQRVDSKFSFVCSDCVKKMSVESW